jgi:exopolysaccharide biosynthesis polyprenyl glycosylphosphotransferase
MTPATATAADRRSRRRVEVQPTPQLVVVGSGTVEMPLYGITAEQLIVKRWIDTILAALAIVLLTPLFLLIAIAIKLDSPGPVFFRQVRAGQRGQPFAMMKFRTMVDRADEIKEELHHLNASGDPRLFKIPNDPRVTRVGRLLRRTSLDELPQLFNVLRGEMSIVGPRPFFPNDLVSYAEHHFTRLSVPPGITGWWQVNGRSDVVDFEEVVRLDREYIERWSVLFDLWIMLRTLPAMLGRQGAY